MTGRERVFDSKSRRSMLKWIGVGSSIALGTGTAAARGDRPRRFGATASDDPELPGHEYIGSDGRGVARYRLDGDELHFDVRLANLNADAVIEGPPLDNQASGVTGTITDADVANAAGDVDTVGELVAELDAERGVFNVHTQEPDGDGGGEIAGLVEARGR